MDKLGLKIGIHLFPPSIAQKNFTYLSSYPEYTQGSRKITNLAACGNFRHAMLRRLMSYVFFTCQQAARCKGIPPWSEMVQQPSLFGT